MSIQPSAPSTEYMPGETPNNLPPPPFPLQESPMSTGAPCEWYKHGHCKGRITGSCKADHRMQNCPNISCKFQSNGCKNRHPRSCRRFLKAGKCMFGPDCSYLHGKYIFIPLNTEPPAMPPDPSVVLTTHCVEEQIPQSSMCQQVMEQAQIILNLKKDLSAQQKKIITLEFQLSNHTSIIPRQNDDLVSSNSDHDAKKVSILCEKIAHLEEVIPDLTATEEKITEKVSTLYEKVADLEERTVVIDKLAFNNNQEIKLVQSNAKCLKGMIDQVIEDTNHCLKSQSEELKVQNNAEFNDLPLALKVVFVANCLLFVFGVCKTIFTMPKG